MIYWKHTKSDTPTNLRWISNKCRVSRQGVCVCGEGGLVKWTEYILEHRGIEHYESMNGILLYVTESV